MSTEELCESFDHGTCTYCTCTRIVKFKTIHIMILCEVSPEDRNEYLKLMSTLIHMYQHNI